MMLKWFWILFGSMSVLIGLLLIWSPLPLGLPLFMIGIPLLMKYSPHSRNSVLWLAGHFPRLFLPLRRVISFDTKRSDPPADGDRDRPYR